MNSTLLKDLLLLQETQPGSSVSMVSTTSSMRGPPAADPHSERISFAKAQFGPHDDSTHDDDDRIENLNSSLLIMMPNLSLIPLFS